MLVKTIIKMIFPYDKSSTKMQHTLTTLSNALHYSIAQSASFELKKQRPMTPHEVNGSLARYMHRMQPVFQRAHVRSIVSSPWPTEVTKKCLFLPRGFIDKAPKAMPKITAAESPLFSPYR